MWEKKKKFLWMFWLGEKLKNVVFIKRNDENIVSEFR